MIFGTISMQRTMNSGNKKDLLTTLIGLLKEKMSILNLSKEKEKEMKKRRKKLLLIKSRNMLLMLKTVRL